ncbi:hypothetical protein Sango_2725600 [Sesamum angolense]|uniref:Uncharacterized protein n=1 Tax=Sesamum angolense TaxID=2727404 RepID=A0AAE1VW58_9LAMI|nr:hypothetical protein Sango_2725600 [Sesamum angolense]
MVFGSKVWVLKQMWFCCCGGQNCLKENMEGGNKWPCLAFCLHISFAVNDPCFQIKAVLLVL